MGFNFGKLVKGAAGMVKGLSKIPGVGMIPIVGNVISAAGTAASLVNAASAFGAFGGGGSKNSLSSSASTGLPPMPSLASAGMGQMSNNPAYQNYAARTAEAGSGGAPPVTPGVIKAYYRAPRGKVVMWSGGHRGVGEPMAVDRKWAVSARYATGGRVFHPAAKPPISVGEFHALRKADRVIKKLKKVNKMAMKVANFGSHRHQPRLQVLEAPGRKLIGRKTA